MREVLLNDTRIEVRGLTVPEIEQLKTEKIEGRKEPGYPLTRFGVDTQRMWPDMDLAEKTLDRVFEMVLKPEDIEELKKGPNKKILETWKAILDETYGNTLEEKNS